MHPSKLIIIKSCIHEYSSSITETPQVRLEQASSHLSSLVFPCLSSHYLLRKPFLQHYYTRRTLIVWRAQRIHTWRAQRIRAGSRKPNGPQTYYYFLIAYFQS